MENKELKKEKVENKLKYSNRWGRFKIASRHIRALDKLGEDAIGTERFEFLLAMLSKILIFKAELLPYSDEIEYIGISEYFVPLKEGEIIPYYTLQVYTDPEEQICSKCGGSGKTKEWNIEVIREDII